MSRVAKNPVPIPSGVTIKLAGQEISVKGAKGELSLTVHDSVLIEASESVIQLAPRDGSKLAGALAGTTRALVNNMVIGTTRGFEKTLQLNGVGYRAQSKGKALDLTIGFSHPVKYRVPEGIAAETPSPTQIVIKGIDKQKVGQVAAEIRAFRPPEPYKGKGIRYADENVRRKEAKKK